MSTSSFVENLPLIGRIVTYFKIKKLVKHALKGVGETIAPGFTRGPFGMMIVDVRNPETRQEFIKMHQESFRIMTDRIKYPEKYLDYFIAEGNYESAERALKVLGRDFTKKELRQLFDIYLSWGHGKLLSIVMRKLGKKRLSYFQYKKFFLENQTVFGATHRPVEFFPRVLLVAVMYILLNMPSDLLREFYLASRKPYDDHGRMMFRQSVIFCSKLLMRQIDATEFHQIMERMTITEFGRSRFVARMESIIGRILNRQQRELLFAYWLFADDFDLEEAYRFAFEDLSRQLNVDDINIALRPMRSQWGYHYSSLIKRVQNFDLLSIQQREQFTEAILKRAQENGIKLDDLQETDDELLKDIPLN